MKILLIGAGGMLGHDVAALLESKCDLTLSSIDYIDITDEAKVIEVLKREEWDVVVNTAAYTNVDGAETNEAMAFEVNGEGAGNLARACNAIGAKLIHISTDFVFDGASSIPYTESSQPAPLSVYGGSKLAGEEAVMREDGDYIIIRTSWLYGVGGDNFPDKIISLARDRNILSIIFDQVGTPTHTLDLAEAVWNLIDSKADSGIYNFSNEGVASWYDFAYLAVELARKEGIVLKLDTLRPIRTEEYPTAAKRPAFSVLDKAKYKRATGAAIAHWTKSLGGYMKERWTTKEKP
ncbi:MAG: dTDP-4-dehydrorhamnose reductase [Deltaproteobacteria bacterium]|nr:dTDP-4-dehydrorhamnose reductase [Deltaproteobacteria bacterium]